MKLVDLKCPHCGAQLEVDADKYVAVCEYCGAEMLIEDELPKSRNYPQTNNQYDNNTAIQEPQKKRKTWLWVLGWLFIFPVPLMIILQRKQNMKPVIKYTLIILGWLLYIFWLIGANTDSQNTTTTLSAVLLMGGR